MVDASILLLAKNELHNIKRCLEAVVSQQSRFTYEIVLVDSGSTDGTLDIARQYPLRLYQVPPEAFHHARTRNYAAGLARGRYLVYLAADAVPAANSWLEALLSNFADPLVAGVYGRHLPKPGCTLERQMVLHTVYGDARIVKESSRKRELGYHYYHFSTVNAALRRDIWESVPFPEELKVYEDVGIAKSILDAGWKTIYEPAAAVYHSHNHTALGLFKRYFDTGVIYTQLRIWDDIWSTLLSDGWRLLRKKLMLNGKRMAGKPMGGSVWYDAAKFAGLMVGHNERLLPHALKRRCSAFRLFG